MALSPTSSRPSGGTAAPITREQLFGPNTSIADNDFAVMSWGSSSGPDSLLNVTVPTLPTIITTGTYAFTVVLGSAESLTVGGYLLGQIELDPNNVDVFVGLQSPNASAAVGSVRVLLAVVWHLTAGDQVKAVISSHDGVAARNFALSAYVQRLA